MTGAEPAGIDDLGEDFEVEPGTLGDAVALLEVEPDVPEAVVAVDDDVAGREVDEPGVEL